MFEKVGSIQRKFSRQPINKRCHASRSAPKQAISHRAPRTPLAQPNYVSQLVTLFGLFAALFGFVSLSYAQPIDPATARDSYTGGGLTISAADLQRIAVGSPPRDVRPINNERSTTAAAIAPSSPHPSDVSASAVALPPTDATFGSRASQSRDTTARPNDPSPIHHSFHSENPESTSTTHALGSSPTMPPLPPTSTPRGGSGRVLLVECNGAFGYATIQSAIDDAIDGDVVVVLPNDCTPEGRWFENINFLGKAIRVQSANPQDDAVVNATIIDGNASGTVVTFENGEGLDSVLDGVVVTNGFSVLAGGISIVQSAPSIRRCVITNNNGGYAGAARIASSQKCVFESCIFDSNSSSATYSMINASQSVVPDLLDCEIRNQSGRYLIVGPAALPDSDSVSKFEGCRFEANTTSQMFNAESLRIESCQFINNVSASIGLNRGEETVIANSVFEGNQNCYVRSRSLIMENSQFISNGIDGMFGVATISGTRISNCDFVANETAPNVLFHFRQFVCNELTIDDCLFEGNTSRSPTVVAESNSPARISNCRFINNRSTASPANVLVTNVSSTTEVSSCLFQGNLCLGSAATGATIRCVGSVVIDSSVFTANRSLGSSAAVMSISSSIGLEPLLRDSTIIGNTSNGPTGGVEYVKLENCIVFDNRGAGGVEDQTAQLAPGTVANYSDIQYFDGLIGPQSSTILSVGNFDLAPRFVDPGYWDDMGTPADPSDDVFIPGDYHLLPDSPCIDVGDPEFVPRDEAIDIDGEARVQSCRVDIGADEFTQDDVIPGDFDGDGFVSLSDVPEFLSVALGPVGSQVCLGDLTGDGRFDGRDIAALTALLIGN